MSLGIKKMYSNVEIRKTKITKQEVISMVQFIKYTLKGIYSQFTVPDTSI